MSIIGLAGAGASALSMVSSSATAAGYMQGFEALSAQQQAQNLKMGQLQMLNNLSEAGGKMLKSMGESMKSLA